MEKATKDWKLTRRGWIVLVIIPAILAAILFGYATHDTCWVGTEHGNALGYGSCSEYIDRVIQEGK
jgi:hypothetical protein